MTSVLIDNDANKIVGYVTLRASSLVGTSSDTNKKLVCPALEIAELAVDKDYEHQGFGTVLLGIAVDIAAELRLKIGIRYIVVCSDPSAVGFYKNNSLVKFEELSSVYEFLHDGWNNACVPLYVALPEIQ